MSSEPSGAWIVDHAYESLVRAAEERSKRLDDPCKHLTRCADGACDYRRAEPPRLSTEQFLA